MRIHRHYGFQLVKSSLILLIQLQIIMPKQHKNKKEEEEIFSQEQSVSNQNRFEEGEQYMVRLVSAFDQVYKMKEWMVPIGEANIRIGDSQLIGKTFILSGPAQCGKTSLVYWALRNDGDTIKVVTIDCSLYRTEIQFIQKLTKDLGEKIGVNGLDRRVVINQNITFSDLNPIILQQGVRVVILIRNAQKLVQVRRQSLLYNLLDWMITEVKNSIGLVFTTRFMFFVERFEKRVLSRLQAMQIVVQRPNPENMRMLLLRRVQCLLEEEQERGNKQGVYFYDKIVHCMYENREFAQVIRDNQQVSQKDIVYYLNAMKVTCSMLGQYQNIRKMPDKDLKELLCLRLKQSFNYIFPFIPKNLLITCTYPEYIVMAIIYHMAINNRGPFRFKTVYQIYLEFRQRLQIQEGTGSAFAYSKGMMERAVLRLSEIKLIDLDSRQESLWNCDIRCCLYPDDLRRTMDQINQKEKLPKILLEILNR